MHVIDLTDQESLSLIARCADHLPVGASLGTIFAVAPAGILTRDGARWCLNVEADYVFRVVSVAAGMVEVTAWQHSEQVYRVIVPDSE